MLTVRNAQFTWKTIQYFPICSVMPKRSLHRPPIKRIKLRHNIVENQGNSRQQRKQYTESSNLRVASNNSGNMSVLDNNVVTEGEKVKVEYLDTPTKSENDKKEYRVIKLENGLTALLISDPRVTDAADEENENDDEVDAITSESEESGSDDEDDEDEEDEEDEEESEDENGCSKPRKQFKLDEKMAACALSVGVGSFSDPAEIPGLAHFLEHMVFMGSEKYPQENDFDMFIKKRGGSDNASTDCEMTTFYFEIQKKHLFNALDCFAQFFIKPLMKRDAIARERESVESEFQMALPSDFYRKEQLFCSLAKPNHPATKFTWGNLVSLRDNVSDDKLYEELHKFHKRHYSAHRMKLAIQAQLPLDVLEEYVTKCFSNVPTNNLPADDFSEFKGADSFDTPIFRRIYKIKPSRDVCQVELTWSMPPMLHLYRSKPHQYVSWIIGHEGKGSLISYLRKKMWCLDIHSGNGESGSELNCMYTLFSLSLILTDEGYEHLKEILDAIFAYLNLMRREGPQKRIYDEIHQIEETNFRFSDEVEPADYVEDLSENMHIYPPKDFISGSELYFEYDPQAIQICLDYLLPTNVNIIINDKRFDDSEFEKVEPWFQTKYTDTEIPQDWVENWKTIEPFQEFHLPLPNIYLTDDFSLIQLPEVVPKYPQKVYSDKICEIWYRPDPKFRLPECYMYFYFISPLAVASAKTASLLDLFVDILKQLLAEELYPAAVAELNYQITTIDIGIVLKLSGYNQKLPILLNTILKYIAASESLISKDLFNVMKKMQIKQYYNKFLKPEKLLKDVSLALVKDVHWSAVDRHAAISEVEFSEFQEFVKLFTKEIYIQIIAQGNMTESDVVKNIRSSLEILNCGPLPVDAVPEIRIIQMPLGTQYCKIKNFNSSDVNSVVTNYYQSGEFSVRLFVLMELIIMIMEEPLFNQLRTLEQLGYSVYCLLRNSFGILGYMITVCSQADKYTTEHVNERIESFLESFKQILEDTSEEELESMKTALTKLKSCADIHLKEEIDRNWVEIITKRYSFDRIEKELAVIESIDIKELKDFMKLHTIGGENLRKLSLHVVGTDKKVEENKIQDSSFADLRDSVAGEDPGTGTKKFPLVYITEKSEVEENAVYITDIPEFKKDLKIFPNRPHSCSGN